MTQVGSTYLPTVVEAELSSNFTLDARVAQKRSSEQKKKKGMPTLDKKDV